MSANSRLKEIATEYGVDDFIEKPFDMQYMLNKIKEVLERKKKSLSAVNLIKLTCRRYVLFNLAVHKHLFV
jgi:DNA-binding response OmpR family regulator